jgi:hypothetical protein
MRWDQLDGAVLNKVMCAAGDRMLGMGNRIIPSLLKDTMYNDSSTDTDTRI